MCAGVAALRGHRVNKKGYYNVCSLNKHLEIVSHRRFVYQITFLSEVGKPQKWLKTRHQKDEAGTPHYPAEGQNGALRQDMVQLRSCTFIKSPFVKRTKSNGNVTKKWERCRRQ
eukprot:GFKZ01005219.1.p1 GENE.GFKZ01005219.1~~GFKZ01005219.1.p1  ORF type:complete len:114 (+),score=6.69 GFKZ01005219.1:90-431(+)